MCSKHAEYQIAKYIYGDAGIKYFTLIIGSARQYLVGKEYITLNYNYNNLGKDNGHCTSTKVTITLRQFKISLYRTLNSFSMVFMYVRYHYINHVQVSFLSYD